MVVTPYHPPPAELEVQVSWTRAPVLGYSSSNAQLSTGPPNADAPSQIQNGPLSKSDINSDLDRRQSSKFGSTLDGGLHPVNFRLGIISASQPTTLGRGTTLRLTRTKTTTSQENLPRLLDF